jgi:hypothetical protein
MIWITDAHRGDGKRYVVRSDEIWTAFLELESAVAASFRSGLIEKSNMDAAG